MSNATSSKSQSLESQVGMALVRWMRYCPLDPCEYLHATANNEGEVWLDGLVCHAQTANEAVSLLQGIPGVKCVFNRVTIMYIGQAQSF